MKFKKQTDCLLQIKKEINYNHRSVDCSINMKLFTVKIERLL